METLLCKSFSKLQDKKSRSTWLLFFKNQKTRLNFKKTISVNFINLFIGRHVLTTVSKLKI